MAVKEKKGLALLVAGKPTKDVEEDYEGEDEPIDEPIDIESEEAPAPEAEYPEFGIPEGLDLSDLEEGDEKQILAVVRKTSDGTACLVSVDGVNLTGAEEAALPEELPTEAPPGESMPPGPMDIRSRAMGAGLM